MSNEALATTQCRVCRRVGISAADRTRLTSGQPRPTTTTTALPAGYVLELQYGCMRIPATSGSVRRSVVAGLCPGYRRPRPRLSISQFLALQVSGVLVDRDQVSEALDRDPDLAVGVAVGDAKSQH